MLRYVDFSVLVGIFPGRMKDILVLMSLCVVGKSVSGVWSMVWVEHWRYHVHSNGVCEVFVP